MDRRDALRLLATGTLLQLAPRSLMAMLREARAMVTVPSVPRTMDAHQIATVKAMAEMIVPKTETPGATDAGAVEFIDLMLTEWFDEADRAQFLDGLADVDARSHALFDKTFVECSPMQQSDILTVLGERMLVDAERNRKAPRSGRGSMPHVQVGFYSMLRHLTLTAYYTSETGATEELNYQVIPDRYDGCTQIQTAKGGPEGQ